MRSLVLVLTIAHCCYRCYVSRRPAPQRHDNETGRLRYSLTAAGRTWAAKDPKAH
jgi:hypothetical protein